MIIGIEGGLGSGKTILMVRYLVKDSLKGHDVYSNFKLKKIDYKPLDVMEILELDKGSVILNDMSIGIDEFTVFADCRTSITKLNRMISYFILQTRKRNVTLYYTTQDITMIDKRIANHTDIRIVADKIKDENGKEIENLRKYYIYDLRDMRHFKYRTLVIDISKYFDFYDTNEVILPPFK